MSGDAFRKVESGDPLRIGAQTWNELLDLHQQFKTGQTPTGASRIGVGNQRSIVYVKNNTGADLDRFNVATIEALEFDPDDSEESFLAEAPVFRIDGPKFDARPIVTTEPIAADEIGTAVFSGWTQAKVDVYSDIERFATIKQDEPGKLFSYAGGEFEILWKPHEKTGDQWCLVQLGRQQDAWLGVTDEEITAADYEAKKLGFGNVRPFKLKDITPDNIEFELRSPSGVEEYKTEVWYNAIPAGIAESKVVIAQLVMGLPTITVESCPTVSVE